MERLKNYHQDRHVYRAYFDHKDDPDDVRFIDLKARNMGHFLQRLAAQLPSEEPQIITVVYIGVANNERT